jgi:uncharacterized peroxidase-related enzyme
MWRFGGLRMLSLIAVESWSRVRSLRPRASTVARLLRNESHHAGGVTMAHIDLPRELPGITAAFAFRPETARPMRELAHILLHEPSTLSPGERELIATYVSARNDCHFCQTTHGAAAAAHLGNDTVVQQVKMDSTQAQITPKLNALLMIAGQVQQGGKHVTRESVAAAREQGASDLEIHDTVLIAAAFCMYNRYVDGLDTWQPQDPDMYRQMGKHLASEGYRVPASEPAKERQEQLAATDR